MRTKILNKLNTSATAVPVLLLWMFVHKEHNQAFSEFVSVPPESMPSSLSEVRVGPVGKSHLGGLSSRALRGTLT